MTHSRKTLSLAGAVLVALLLGSGSAPAQIPDTFTNLEVLPKDISKGQLISIMRNFSTALGVRCNYCHVGEDPNSLEGYDFASDEPRHKQITRTMMKMTGEINGTLMPDTGIESPVRVRCITCHRGVEEPETLDNLLLGVIEKDGVPAAATRYTQLREEYYGTGSYDFSAGTLNSVAESLAREKNDVDGAIAIMQRNVKDNPEAAGSHLLLGQLYAQKGETEAAIASIERCLELEPDNRWAQQMLEKIKSSD